MSNGSVKSAFGTYLVSPEKLSHEERLGLVMKALDHLPRGEVDRYTGALLADGIRKWMCEGGDLARHLGLRPPRGSRRSAANIDAMRRRDRLLLRLADCMGSDAEALRVLRGDTVCPKKAKAIVDEFREFGAPGSSAAFTRARRSLSRDR